VATDTTAEQGLRERKKQQTRDQLIAAAFELFEKHGFDKVSAAEIAAAVGVSERTFFRYFPSKEDVVFPDFDESRHDLDAVLSNLPAELSLVEGLRECLQEMSHGYEDSRELHLKRARLAVTTPSLQTHFLLREQEVIESFANAVAKRLGLDMATDMRPELTAAVVVAVFRVVLGLWIRSGGEGDMRQILDEALAFVGTGLAAFGPEAGSVDTRPAD